MLPVGYICNVIGWVLGRKLKVSPFTVSSKLEREQIKHLGSPYDTVVHIRDATLESVTHPIALTRRRLFVWD